MRHYRRHSIVVILIISAIVTPTPDPMTQLMLALPMLLLFELSIFVSKIAMKREKPLEAEQSIIPKEEHS
jgi:sec-independent protein translocase protein TatC